MPIPASSTPATPSASLTESTQAPQTPTETLASTNAPAWQREDLEPPTLSDVALENSADGAEAYAYFLFQAWWYLINTLDIDWWDENFPDCDWKTKIRDIAMEKKSRNVSSETAPITPYVTSRKVNPDNSSEFAITMRAEVADIYEIDRGGRKEISTKATTFELTARLAHRGEVWNVVGVVNRTVEDAQ